MSAHETGRALAEAARAASPRWLPPRDEIPDSITLHNAEEGRFIQHHSPARVLALYGALDKSRAKVAALIDLANALLASLAAHEPEANEALRRALEQGIPNERGRVVLSDPEEP